MTEPTGFLTIARYFCAVCGNEEVAGNEQIGPLCQPFLDGPLRQAWEALQLIRQEWGVCCWGISSELGFGRTWEERVRNFGPGTYLYVHPKTHGESSYYIREGRIREETPGDEPAITVECGVRLYQTNASCYWIFDNDTMGFSQGEPLDGGPVSYAFIGGEEVFLPALAAILDDAAEQAYMGDHGQCAECGGHYYMPNGPCCEGGEPDQDAQERCDCGHNFASHDPDRDASIEACAYLGFCGECNGADEAGMTPADYAASDFAYDAARERGRL